VAYTGRLNVLKNSPKASKSPDCMRSTRSSRWFVVKGTPGEERGSPSILPPAPMQGSRGAGLLAVEGVPQVGAARRGGLVETPHRRGRRRAAQRVRIRRGLVGDALHHLHEGVECLERLGLGRLDHKRLFDD